MDKIDQLIQFIYPDQDTALIRKGLDDLIDRSLPIIQDDKRGGMKLNQQDALLITYADNLRDPEKTPLESLNRFAHHFLENVLSGIHILPFFPYSSDDGFSVIDYRKVKAEWGSWKEIDDLSRSFSLMFDLVLNHCSRQSGWFQAFLKDIPPYNQYFIAVDPEEDLSAVFRPRALPLLTEVESVRGKLHVWTTFSEDQIDLNFADPQVLLQMIDILLTYLIRGARLIRLDAIAFLWKEIGTACLHHPRTHAVVKLFRTVLEQVCPEALLITETNVPHKENISYFGEGDEASMVYQFPLPPLTLDAFIRQDAGYLTAWAESLPAPGKDQLFFNFLASHDGVGILAARDYLTAQEFQHLLDTVQKRGGFVSFKSTPEGEVPYELNINYLSAVTQPDSTVEEKARVFMASQAVMLSMAGIPGIYIHSLIGSENDEKAVLETGVKRRINREKLDYAEVAEKLADESSLRSRVYRRFKQLLEIRSQHPAFSPVAGQTILDLGSSVFSLVRRCEEEGIFVLINVSSKRQTVKVPDIVLIRSSHPAVLTCLMDPECRIVSKNRFIELEIEPYEIRWMDISEELPESD